MLHLLLPILLSVADCYMQEAPPATPRKPKKHTMSGTADEGTEDVGSRMDEGNSGGHGGTVQPKKKKKRRTMALSAPSV